MIWHFYFGWGLEDLILFVLPCHDIVRMQRDGKAGHFQKGK